MVPFLPSFSFWQINSLESSESKMLPTTAASFPIHGVLKLLLMYFAQTTNVSATPNMGKQKMFKQSSTSNVRSASIFPFVLLQTGARYNIHMCVIFYVGAYLFLNAPMKLIFGAWNKCSAIRKNRRFLFRFAPRGRIVAIQNKQSRFPKKIRRFFGNSIYRPLDDERVITH